MLLLRLRGRKVCDRLIRQGNLWRGKHMHIRWMAGPPRHPSVRRDHTALYIGTLASTKLDKSAVRRNRMRRRCREALRILAGDLTGIPVSLQLLIAPRSSSLGAPFAELQSDLRQFLSTRFHG